MKTPLLIITVCLSFCHFVFSQTQSSTQTKNKMKLNAGIITSKIKETRDFYVNNLGFGVSFENEFYLLMHTPDHSSEISFLLPNHPSQQSFFHKPFQGQGMYVTIEVEDVDKIYSDIRSKGVAIKIDIRNEPWGDRHFAIEDPNGIGIDIVTYSPAEQN
jgi:catechol 2,3-dioxygenase-like lactoylglutathione lyase family enzyme